MVVVGYANEGLVVFRSIIALSLSTDQKILLVDYQLNVSPLTFMKTVTGAGGVGNQHSLLKIVVAGVTPLGEGTVSLDLGLALAQAALEGSLPLFPGNKGMYYLA